MSRRLLPICFLTTQVVLASIASAEPPAATNPAPIQSGSLSAAAAKRIEQERVRQIVEDSLEGFAKSADSAGEQNEQLVHASTRLVELGTDALPFLLNELDSENPFTFTFTAYTLGRLGLPEAIPALKKAIARAKDEPGDYGAARRTWSVYGLSMLGDDSGLEIFNDGTAGDILETVHFDMTILEAAAYFTAPQSTERLHEMWKTWADDEERRDQRFNVIKALGRIADPSSLPILLEATRDSKVVNRREAALAMIAYSDPNVSAAWMRLMTEDEDPTVRWFAAKAMLRQRFNPPIDVLEARLAVEPDTHVRGQVYRLLARSGGKKILPQLLKQWGLPASEDRLAWVEAVGSLDTVRAVEPLGRALGDRDLRVAEKAVEQLAAIQSPRSLELLRAQLDSSDWNRVRAAIDALARLKDVESLSKIADRLIDEMHGVVQDPDQRARLTFLAETLVQQGSFAVLDRVRAPAARQQDGALKAYLPQLIARLEALRDLNDQPGKLRELMEDPSAGMRAVGIQGLARLGTPEAIAALIDGFDTLPIEDQVLATRLIGELDSKPTRTLVSRLLADESWDGIRFENVRAEAAWCARRFGGADMVEALRSSAIRRDGRDPVTLYALALIAGPGAIPTFEQVKLARLKYLKGSRGTEQRYFDWALRQLRMGGSLDEFDRVPATWDYFVPF